MANQITKVPTRVSNAGHSFNYAVWTAESVLTLVNAPWDAEYNNVVEFPTTNGLDNWIDSRQHRLVVENMKHMRLDNPIRIDAPFEVASQFNYIRARNPKQPINGSLPSVYYYFIRSVKYVAPNTTELILQLDAWASFRPAMNILRAYVERGHIGIANSKQNENNGRKYLTVAEGLDAGGEMMIARTYSHSIATTAFAENMQGSGFSVMVVATTDLAVPPGADREIKTATGSVIEGMPHGASIYVFESPSVLQEYLDRHSGMPWVTQGISSITAVPSVRDWLTNPVDISESAGLQNKGMYHVNGAGPDVLKSIALAADWRADSPLPDRYKGLNKFNCFPYAAIELTMFSGQPIVLKPEQMWNRNISVGLMIHLSPGGARFTAVPLRYNARDSANDNNPSADKNLLIFDRGEWLDFSTSMSNLPQFTTVNNMSAMYAASNRNSISFQYNQASWDQQRAMMNAGNAQSNAQAGIAGTNATANANLDQISAASSEAQRNRSAQGGVQLLGAAGNTVGGMIGSAGNIPGLVGGAISGAVNMTNVVDSTRNDLRNIANMSNINQTQVSALNRASVNQQSAIMDNNYAYADKAARGDYAMAIEGIQAKVQDSTFVQPTVSGQLGGDSFNLAKMGWGVFARVKRITEGAMAELGEFWLRYGYRVNRWVDLPKSLLTHDKFTYWKVQEVFIDAANCPELYKQSVRGILEKGVTVWSSPDLIGRVDIADNNPKNGVSY